MLNAAGVIHRESAASPHCATIDPVAPKTHVYALAELPLAGRLRQGLEVSACLACCRPSRLLAVWRRVPPAPGPERENALPGFSTCSQCRVLPAMNREAVACCPNATCVRAVLPQPPDR